MRLSNSDPDAGLGVREVASSVLLYRDSRLARSEPGPTGQRVRSACRIRRSQDAREEYR